jgi:hypothetical protein
MLGIQIEIPTAKRRRTAIAIAILGAGKRMEQDDLGERFILVPNLDITSAVSSS